LVGRVPDSGRRPDALPAFHLHDTEMYSCAPPDPTRQNLILTFFGKTVATVFAAGSDFGKHLLK
jgi:hypothetical protein